MISKVVTLTSFLVGVSALYPYYDTQDFIYNVPKVNRVILTIDKLLDHYVRKLSKDPEFHISLAIASRQLQHTINELNPAVPKTMTMELTKIEKKIGYIQNMTNMNLLAYRSRDYEYVAKTILANLEVYTSMLEPLTLGTVGAQPPYRFSFERYTDEASGSTPSRKAADSCTMQLLTKYLDGQNSTTDLSCDLSLECRQQILEGMGFAYQMTSRLRTLALARLLNCGGGTDLDAAIYKICVHVYKEAVSLEAWNHPSGTSTLFMQQIFYCSSQGYGEFIKPRWMNKIISWQNPRGCYVDDKRYFEKLTGFAGETWSTQKDKRRGGSPGIRCNSLTSGMALGSLAMYVRALLETDGAFQYDIFE